MVSYNQAAFSVDEAPPATAAPTSEPDRMSDVYFVPGIAAIIVVIILVGAVLALLVTRKRP